MHVLLAKSRGYAAQRTHTFRGCQVESENFTNSSSILVKLACGMLPYYNSLCASEAILLLPTFNAGH